MLFLSMRDQLSALSLSGAALSRGLSGRQVEQHLSPDYWAVSLDLDSG